MSKLTPPMLASFKAAYFEAYGKEIDDGQAEELGAQLLETMVFMLNAVQKNRRDAAQKFDTHLVSDDSAKDSSSPLG